MVASDRESSLTGWLFAIIFLSPFIMSVLNSATVFYENNYKTLCIEETVSAPKEGPRESDQYWEYATEESSNKKDGETSQEIVRRGKDGLANVCYQGKKKTKVLSHRVIVEPVAPKIKETTYIYKPIEVWHPPAYTDNYGGAICNDGSRSFSTGRGTCSWHGGVWYYL